MIFGREKSGTGSKAAIGTPMFFSCFRPDLYEKHMAGQHPAKWPSQNSLQSGGAREAFFQVIGVPYVERLESVFEKSAAWAPNMVWWIFLFALREVARVANAVFVSLQGLATLVQQQDDRFSGLVDKLLCLSGTFGPLNAASIRELDCNKHEVIGSFAFSRSPVEKYVINLHMWVCKSFKSLTNEQKKTVVIAVGRLYLLAISSIQTLSLSTEPTPPVTPRTRINYPAGVVRNHDALHDRVVQHFGEAGIDRISQELKQLCRDYNTKKPIRETIDHRLASFDEMWHLGDAAAKHPTLGSFCGGIASVFPNTATVESDFSVKGCEKIDK